MVGCQIRQKLVVGLALAACLALAQFGTSARAEAPEPKTEMGANGLHVQPWFLQSFLDLREDLIEARQKGKRLVLIFEQKGCPYCREMHLTNFANPKIRTYIRKNFEILQIDLWGARKVTDFEGQVLSEKRLARKYQMRFTPTVVFLPVDVPKGKAGKDIEVARMPGYLRPRFFLIFFEYVNEKAYRFVRFLPYLKAKLATPKG